MASKEQIAAIQAIFADEQQGYCEMVNMGDWDMYDLMEHSKQLERIEKRILDILQAQDDKQGEKK